MIDQNKLKRIPYGLSDFKEIREKNYYYVDKTRFIIELEELGNYLFLIRPRRFGKSLLVSLLQQYYDILNQERFDLLFQGTDIYQNPTPNRNKYAVLTFDFSTVNPKIEKVEQAFLTSVKFTVRNFLDKYQTTLDININAAITEINSLTTASEVMEALLFYCSNKKYKLYTIFDEYDNFANTILSECGQNEFEKITHGTGFLRSFFNVIKSGASRSDALINRIFMTGVSPITMDDVTSGFNIGSHISLDSQVNEILGFTLTEVQQMIDYYQQSGTIHHNTPELLEIMGHWYSHYNFSPRGKTQLFNTDQVLYFLRAYMWAAQMPLNMIDNNARIDYGKLRHLILVDQKGTSNLNGNFSKLQHIIETNHVETFIQESFPVEDMAQSENFYSLLFYFGLLSITGTTAANESILSIPNEFVKRLYYNIIQEAYKKVNIFKIDWGNFSTLMSDMALNGKWQPLIEYISGEMVKALALRDSLNSEKAHQVFWQVYLGQNRMYNAYSEMELNHGFADLALIPLLAQNPLLKYSYLLEFKYIKPAKGKNKEATREKIEELRLEAENQLNQYSQDQKLLEMIKPTTLKKIILIFSGHKLVFHSESISV